MGVTDRKRSARKRLAAGLALLLLALLFVAQERPGSGFIGDVRSPNPSTTPTPTESVRPSEVPSSQPQTPTPSPSTIPSGSQLPAPTGSAGLISACSDHVDIGLESEWLEGRFVVRMIKIDVPSTECNGVSAQVLLLDEESRVLLRRDGIISEQRVVFNVLSEELNSLRVKSTAFELTSKGSAPVTVLGSSSLRLDIYGTLGGSVETLSVTTSGYSLIARSVVEVLVGSSRRSTLIGDDGSVTQKRVLNNLDAGSYLITARAEGRSGSLVRRAFIAIDNGRRIVVLIRDFDAWLQVNGPNATPTLPVLGSGAAILTAEDGRLVYLDERASTNSWAANLGLARETLTRPQVLLGGVVAGVLIALIGLIAGLMLDIVRAKVRTAFESAIGSLRVPDFASSIPHIFGFRVDVVPFLLVGQAISALNAPLELIPPPLQLVQGAILGAVGVVLVSEFGRLPRIYHMRRTVGDVGLFVGRWGSLVLAAIALTFSHAANIVPGIIVGLFATRKFRLEVGEADDANVTFQSSLLQAIAAACAWVVVDTTSTLVPDPETPIRAISDGILSTIVVAGSHGLLASLINPTDKGSMSLRRAAPVRWIGLIGIAGALVVGIISTGGSAEALFGPSISVLQLSALAVVSTAILTLALIATRQHKQGHYVP